MVVIRKVGFVVKVQVGAVQGIPPACTDGHSSTPPTVDLIKIMLIGTNFEG